MARREYPLRFECAHPGCAESVTYRYPTRRDLSESFELKHYSGGRWKCSRHNKPAEVLGTDNLQTVFEIVSQDQPHGRYFGHSGFISGPGFKIWSKDLPAGTKLIVTARIELPQESK